MTCASLTAASCSASAFVCRASPSRSSVDHAVMEPPAFLALPWLNAFLHQLDHPVGEGDGEGDAVGVGVSPAVAPAVGLV